MTAGLNLQVSIIKINDMSDDSIGGASPSGTVTYTNIPARISARKPTQALLEQGLDLPSIFAGVIAPGNVQVRQNDQVQVTSPKISQWYNYIFRIIGIQYSSMQDPRQYLVVTLRRIEFSHTNQLQ